MIRSLFSTRSLAVVAACVATVLCADVASAQEAAASGRALIDLTSAFGVGLVVIGAAFGKVVTSLTEDMIMPVIGFITGGVDFSSKFISSQTNLYVPIRRFIINFAARIVSA
jgi:large-conductance mechanosensitive channel